MSNQQGFDEVDVWFIRLLQEHRDSVQRGEPVISRWHQADVDLMYNVAALLPGVESAPPGGGVVPNVQPPPPPSPPTHAGTDHHQVIPAPSNPGAGSVVATNNNAHNNKSASKQQSGRKNPSIKKPLPRQIEVPNPFTALIESISDIREKALAKARGLPPRTSSSSETTSLTATAAGSTMTDLTPTTTSESITGPLTFEQNFDAQFRPNPTNTANSSLPESRVEEFNCVTTRRRGITRQQREERGRRDEEYRRRRANRPPSEDEDDDEGDTSIMDDFPPRRQHQPSRHPRQLRPQTEQQAETASQEEVGYYGVTGSLGVWGSHAATSTAPSMNEIPNPPYFAHTDAQLRSMGLLQPRETYQQAAFLNEYLAPTPSPNPQAVLGAVVRNAATQTSIDLAPVPVSAPAQAPALARRSRRFATANNTTGSTPVSPAALPASRGSQSSQSPSVPEATSSLDLTSVPFPPLVRRRGPAPTHAPGPAVFRCSHCVAVLASQGGLNRHIQSKHTNPAQWQYWCPWCGKRFPRGDMREPHLKYCDEYRHLGGIGGGSGVMEGVERGLMERVWGVD